MDEIAFADGVIPAYSYVYGRFLNCKFIPQEKDASNSQNAYNQNFKGLYCTCQRPYPDMEDEVLSS